MQIKKALLGLSLLSLGACGGMDEVSQEPTTEVATVEKFLRVERPVRDEYIVVLKNGANGEAGALARSLVGNRGEVLYTYNGVFKGFAVRMSEAAARALSQLPNVAFVEQNQEVSLSQVTQSTGTTYWNLDRIDQRNLPLDQRYTYTTTGAGVNVYVVDTGIRATHTQFTGRIGPGFTSITDGQGTNDCQGHGTHVSGTVAGSLAGVAKQAIIYPVRVFGCTGSTTTAAIVSGVDWIRLNHRKPAVANMSLGGAANTTIDTAVNNLINAGVTVVVAAGNSNQNACNFSPARVANAITVGSTGPSTTPDTRSSFSNFGSCVDIFAPGSSITSSAFNGDTATSVLSGTSMASPAVAGAAARYLEANPAATPAQVATFLINNATVGVVGNAGTGSPNRLLYMAPNQ